MNEFHLNRLTATKLLTNHAREILLKYILGTLSNDDDDNDNVKKTIGFMSKEQLYTCITLFSTFL